MDGATRDVVINLIAALIGATLSFSWTYARRKVREKTLSRSVRLFFGLPGSILVVHSAVFDKPEQAYNYPATDTRAARTLAALFESVGLREGSDFTISPDRKLNVDDALLEQNLVLLCGPARNKVFQHIAPISTAARYSMTVGKNGRNVLTDKTRQQRLRSARELKSESDTGFDFGLVTSLPNPHMPGKRIVLLAGIHGTGTVGAAEFVASRENLRRLVKGHNPGTAISKAVRVDYLSEDRETPTRIGLV